MATSPYASFIFEWSIFAVKCTAGILSLIAVLLYTHQDKLLYFPNPPGFPQKPADNPAPFRSPGDWSLNGKKATPQSESIPYEEEHLPTPDGKLIHTWLMLQSNSMNVPTLIYFHGNAAAMSIVTRAIKPNHYELLTQGNMGLRLKNAALMYSRCGINILMMDYRGFGNSTGVPSEVGLNVDAVTVMEYARNHPRLKDSPLVAFGRSLGGAVAICLASRYPDIIKAVIAENTFLSVGAMVDVLMPFLRPIKSIVLRIDWRSDILIQELRQPIMLISGDSDELVPPSQMKELSVLASKSVNMDFFSVSGGGHNDTFDKAGAQYYERLREFLMRAFPDFKIARGNAGEKPVTVTVPSVTTCAADLNFDTAEYLELSPDSETAKSLPTMQTDFRIR